jgi:hypothetical protein
MKEFTVAAKAQADEDAEVEAPIEFKIGEEVFRAYRPTAGQIAVMTSRMDDLSTDMEKLAAIIDFFVGCLDKESNRILSRKLMDRDDPFEMEDVNDILSWLMEQWSGRPTQPSSASARSPRTNGRKSTAKPQLTESTLSASA